MAAPPDADVFWREDVDHVAGTLTAAIVAEIQAETGCKVGVRARRGEPRLLTIQGPAGQIVLARERAFQHLEGPVPRPASTAVGVAPSRPPALPRPPPATTIPARPPLPPGPPPQPAAAVAQACPPLPRPRPQAGGVPSPSQPGPSRPPAAQPIGAIPGPHPVEEAGAPKRPRLNATLLPGPPTWLVLSMAADRFDEDADIWIDCRVFHDPGASPWLRRHCGQHVAIQRRLCAHSAFGPVLSRVKSLTQTLRAERPGGLLRLGLFCRAGRHRSVALAELLAPILAGSLRHCERDQPDGWPCRGLPTCPGCSQEPQERAAVHRFVQDLWDRCEPLAG